MPGKPKRDFCEIAMPVCKQCGQPIPERWANGHRKSSYQMRVQKFCSYRCARKDAAAGVVTRRNCVMCGAEFVVNKANRGQKCCSRTCGARYSAAVGKTFDNEPYETVNGRRVHYCDCGELATEEVHFYTISSTGNFIAQTLEVCPSCREYMLENDPGCSPTQLPDRDDWSWGFDRYEGV